MVHLEYMPSFAERTPSSSREFSTQQPKSPDLRAIAGGRVEDTAARSRAAAHQRLSQARDLFADEVSTAEEVEELPQDWLEEEPANDNAEPFSVQEQANDNDQDARYRRAAQDLYEARMALAQTPSGDLFRDELERRVTDAEARMQEAEQVFAEQNFKRDEVAWADNPNLPHNRLAQEEAVPSRSPEEAARRVQEAWKQKEGLNQQIQATEDQIGEAILRNNQYASDIAVKQQEITQLRSQGGRSGMFGRFLSVFSGQEARQTSEQLRLQEEALQGFERKRQQAEQESRELSKRLKMLRDQREELDRRS
jgi:hypothetical protein